MERLRADRATAESPAWATRERSLLEGTADAVDIVMDRYVNDDGSVMWPTEEDHTGIDALDDAYESFYNWPLLYMLGGDEKLLDLAKREFDAITEQFAQYDTGHGHPMVVKEYEQGYDWFHQGEGYLLFYLISMADPDDERFRERAQRYAGFYLNEDPEVPDLYDEDHHLIKSPMVGSKGPAYRNFSSDTPEAEYGTHAEPRVPWEYREWKESHGLPFVDVPGVDSVEDLKDPDAAERMGDAIAERWARGDVVANLSATTMLLNAYLLTGKEKYRERIVEYVDAWRERAAENDGIVPDNVDLDGDIGGNIDGKWYGGHYGWGWPHGFHNVINSVTIGAENAYLLTQNDSYLEFPRAQFDAVFERGYVHDGEFYFPQKHGDTHDYDYDPGHDVLREENGTLYQEDGWYHFSTNTEYAARSHLWYHSLEEEDAARLTHPPETAVEPTVEPRFFKWAGGHQQQWYRFLQGEFPAYPEEILATNQEMVAERLEFIRRDDQDPATYEDNYLQDRNPIITEGLVQCILGAPQLIYYGSLQPATVRPFDGERERPGLPEETALLVTGLEADRVEVELVNVGSEWREVVLQAGAFGEHRFGTVVHEADDGDGGRQRIGTSVDDVAVGVELAPGAATTIDAEFERFVGDPSYAFPWDRN